MSRRYRYTVKEQADRIRANIAKSVELAKELKDRGTRVYVVCNDGDDIDVSKGVDLDIHLEPRPI
jgi:hypothetical protein